MENGIFAALEQAVAGARCLVVQGRVVLDDTAVGDELNVIIVRVRELEEAKVYICKTAWHQLRSRAGLPDCFALHNCSSVTLLMPTADSKLLLADEMPRAG